MQVRKAGGEEMLKLWGYQDASQASPTAEFFYRNIMSGNAVFWTLDRDDELYGELYAFLDLETDKDFADGKTSAYLCAFRVKKEFRGQGYGRKLMAAALEDLRERGFRYATIGVNEAENEKLYRRMGFVSKIKDCYFDPCAMDENMRPEADEAGYSLLRKQLLPELPVFEINRKGGEMMFTAEARDLKKVLQDFGIEEEIQAVEELQRYHYEKHDPASREVRLILKVQLPQKNLVIRFRNEQDVTASLLEEQSRFAARLYAKGIATPKLYQSEGRYAKGYVINGYEVLVTVEAFMAGEIGTVDAETAEKTGILLARMHSFAEAENLHVDNRVLFDPLADNDLFEPAAFFCHEELLRSVDENMYEKIRNLYDLYMAEIRRADAPHYAVQGDLSCSNLFLAPNGEIGVFDFNRCGDSCLFFDAVMQGIFTARLMEYPEALAGHAEEVILPAFCKGYHGIRPFTAGQQAVYPYLYAMVSAFWRMDMRWSDRSLAKAVEQGDRKAVRHWLHTVYRRLSRLPEMPV